MIVRATSSSLLPQTTREPGGRPTTSSWRSRPWWWHWPAGHMHRILTSTGGVAGFFAGDLPDWLSASLTIVYIIGFLYSFVLLIGVLFFGQGRVAVARDMFSAGLLALFLAGCLALAAGPEWVDILPELLERDGFPSYPVVRLATAIAITRVAAPYLAAPMRTVGRRVMIGMAISALVMTYGTVTGVIGAVALGVGSAAVIHLVFGSGVGIPSKPRVRDALAHVGVEATDLSYAPVQPVGAALLDVRLVDGSDAVVRFYGRDASDTATAAKLWRTMWYRGRPEAITATPLQQVEHESLTLLHCKMEQAPAAELLAWGQGPAGDAFVVTAPVPGVPLDQLDEVSDETLEQAWRSLQALHGIGVAHGAIDASIVFVDGERVTFRRAVRCSGHAGRAAHPGRRRPAAGRHCPARRSRQGNQGRAGSARR